jgi:diguanylate cyclase (GGDEF)-like protein
MVQVSILGIFAIWVAFTGFLLAKEIILPVINLALETKIMASGESESDLMEGEKEIGNLEQAVNNMTGQLKGYVGELQEYSKKSYSLNARIHKKVLTLTNLMRLGDMINSGVRFKEAADFSTVRMAEEISRGFCALYTKQDGGKYVLVSSYDKSGRFMDSTNISEDLRSLEKNTLKKGFLILDPEKRDLFRRNKGLSAQLDFNAALVPMLTEQTVVGMIVAGNFDRKESFREEDMNVFRAYAKELVLAFESEQLGRRIKEYEVVDTVTGLYSFSYLKERLGEEINRSVYYQRPCSLILVRLRDLNEYTSRFGSGKTELALKRIAETLSRAVPPVGKIGRFEEDEFAVLLPEMNKRESLDMAKKLIDKIGELKFPSKGQSVEVNGGVGENPIDGATAEEIIKKARLYAEKAYKEGPGAVIGW